MAWKISNRKIRSSNQTVAEPGGVDTADHYIQTIVGASVVKLSTIYRQGMMVGKYRRISSLTLGTSMNEDMVSSKAVLSEAKIFSEPRHCIMRLNKAKVDEESRESSTNTSNCRSNETCDVIASDDMTLKELHNRCRAKKQKVSIVLHESTTTDFLAVKEFENENHSKVDIKVERSDLSESLVNFRSKVRKRRMDKGNMTKARKVFPSDSPSSSVTVEDITDLLYPRHVKVELMDDVGEGECVLASAMGAVRCKCQRHLGEAFHLSPQPAESEPLRVSQYSGSSEVANDVMDDISGCDFQDQLVAVNSEEGTDGNFITKCYVVVDEPVAALPEIIEEPGSNSMMLMGNKFKEVIGSELENVPSCEHTKDYSSENSAEDTEAEPSIQKIEVCIAATVDELSHCPVELFLGTLENEGFIEMQRKITNNFPHNVTCSRTNDIDNQCNFPEKAQDNSELISGANVPQITNYECASLSDYCTGSTLVQDKAGIHPLEMTSGVTVSSLKTENDTNPKHGVQLGGVSNPEANLHHIPLGGDNTYAESKDYAGVDNDSFQMNYVNNAHMDGSQYASISAKQMQNSGSIEQCIVSSHACRGDFDVSCTSAASNGGDGISDYFRGKAQRIWEDVIPSSEPLVPANVTSETEISHFNASDNIDKNESKTRETCKRVASSLIIEGYGEIEEHKCLLQPSSCPCSSITENLILVECGSQEAASCYMPSGDRIGENISCNDIQAPEERESYAFKFPEDLKPTQPPKKFPSNRKVFSPTSRENFYQALDAEEFYEKMKYYRNRRRLCFDKLVNSPSDLECREVQAKSSTEEIIVKPRISSHIPKGILKSACSSYMKGCNMQDGSSASSHSQDAIKFSQRQMHDIDCVTEKLLAAVKSMKSIMEDTVSLEEFSSTHLKSTADKMTMAIENAAAVEETTQKYMSMMNRDFKRFCKIMRSRENYVADKLNDASKKQKKITFADEAGGLLCQVKVFEQSCASSMGSAI